MLETLFFVAAALLIIVGAWSAACDAALGVVSRADIAGIAEGSRQRAALLAIAQDLPTHIMSTVFARIVSETTAAVLLTLAIGSLVEEWWIVLLIAGGLMIVVSFIIVGTSPRAVGRTHARTLLRLSAPLIRLQRILLGPLAGLIIAVGDRITPGRQRETAFTSEEQLLSMVDEATSRDVLEEDDRELIHSIFEFNETIVREVMVPRTDMVTVDADMVAEDALKRFLETGLSRMPVVRDSFDDIDSILYLRDVVKSRTWRPEEHETAVELARAAILVPDSKKADDTLAQMQLEKVHVALVIDEFGGIAGLVTLEDLIEELVGEIHDEYDRLSAEVVEQGDGSYLVSSRLQVDELGDLFGLTIDDDDVDSVGGLVQKELGRIARIGDVVRALGLVLRVEMLDGRGRKTGVVRVTKERA